MACDFMIPKGMTPQRRKKQIEETMAALKAALAAKTVKAVVDKRTGALAFVNADGTDWKRNGISDVCAYRKLGNSQELRQARERAEILAGRTVNSQAIAAGTHTHDGGNTWHKGH